MGREYNLEDRLLRFAADTCRVAEQMPASRTGNHICSQLIRCGTSPSANYAEARGSESRRDFVHKLKLCLKELRESLAWLRLVARLDLRPPAQLETVLGEANELIAIMVVSVRTAKGNARGNARNIECPEYRISK